MRTLTVKKTSGTLWATGWHQLNISSAKYGDYNGSKFIELAFEDYPDNFTLRIYAKVGKDGEEFAIGNVFRFANAGITEVLEGTGGDKVVKLDDSADNMAGKSLNVFFYKDGDYTRAYSSVAPTVFENAIDTFTEKDVEYWKKKAETRFENYTPGSGATVDSVIESNNVPETTSTSSPDVPF
tara:strand:+ start:2022 stop:2567 length:546 start_codon:yes stop_codon:yes gene_type:complete